MAVSTDIHRGLVLAGRYRVDRRIGVGGSAAVFLAEDDVLDRDVAVKRVHTDGTEDDVRRLRREARLGASLAHPNLVMIYDTITAADGVFVVMEHVDGRPLSELIGDHGLEPDEALPILWAVADALDYAHANGVVHRDVKPANVVIGADGQIKLVDLGAAIGADVTRVTQAHEVVGTLTYLAPERLSGESVGEPSGDIYSLAVLAFETLSGAPPRLGASPQEHLGRALHGAPDVLATWPEASPSLAAALERGMDPEPDARPATAGELVAAIEDALAPASEPTQAFPPPAAEPPAWDGPPEPAPRSPWPQRWGPAILVAGALLVAAVVFAATRGGEGSPSAPSHQASAGPGSGDDGSQHGARVATQTTPTNATPSTSTSTTTPAAPAGTSGASLNDQGYALIQAGDYEGAIPVLQRAVEELSSNPDDLTYAYALFNLGHALRLAGRPDDAIPILEQRLKIPNQTETVQAELDAARAAAGGAVEGAKPPKPAKPPKDEKVPPGRALGHDKHGGVPPDEGD